MSPLSAVLEAIESGATTQAAMVRTTHLDPDVVAAAVDHLERLGRVSRPELRMACPTSGCGSCPVSSDGRCGG